MAENMMSVHQELFASLLPEPDPTVHFSVAQAGVTLVAGRAVVYDGRIKATLTTAEGFIYDVDSPYDGEDAVGMATKVLNAMQRSQELGAEEG